MSLRRFKRVRTSIRREKHKADTTCIVRVLTTRRNRRDFQC